MYFVSSLTQSLHFPPAKYVCTRLDIKYRNVKRKRVAGTSQVMKGDNAKARNRDQCVIETKPDAARIPYL